VEILKRYVMEHFPDCTVLRYALEVEKLTTRKKSNLILNVDGTIGCAFVDLLRGSGAFTREEADEYIKGGVLNGLFVLGRSIGFIGHYLDQKRLKQSLYRHPWDDICYMCARAHARRRASTRRGAGRARARSEPRVRSRTPCSHHPSARRSGTPVPQAAAGPGRIRLRALVQ
jgi:ATP citrate (pro-S)-lyase